MILIKATDKNNILVILTKQTWYYKLLDPIFGHPEVKPFLHQLKKTIQTPDYIYQSSRDPRCKLFFSKIPKGTSVNYFLTVVVKYIKEGEKLIGYVSTVMINRKLPKTAKLLWVRKSYI